MYPDSIYLHSLYPFFLSFVYAIFGQSITAAACCQIFLDSLTCIFLYFIGFKIFGKKSIGLLSSFIYAFYGIAIFYTGFLLSLTLAVFLSVSLILILLTAKEKEKSLLWFFSGLIMGLSMLLRTNIILFFPFVIFYACTSLKTVRKTVFRLSLISLGLFLILTSFSVRNYAINGRFSPLPAHGGINFYISNNPHSHGGYTALENMPDSAVDIVKASVRLAQKESGKNLTSEQASAYWFSKAAEFIKNNKKQYFFLTLRKLFLFWNSEEISLNLNYYFSRKFLPILNLPLFSFGLIAPLAILGIFFALREKAAKAYLMIAFILAYMISLLVFYVAARYRLPCIPFMIVLASYALHVLVRLIRFSRMKEFIMLFFLTIALMFLVNKETGPVNSKNYFGVSYNNLGAVYADRGNLDEAIVNFKKAIELNSDYAQGHYNLGTAYYQKGMKDEAITAYRLALTINPDYAKVYKNLAIHYYLSGDFKQARQHYLKALAGGVLPDRELDRELLKNPAFE